MRSCRVAVIVPLAALFLVTGIPDRAGAQVGSWMLSGRIHVSVTVDGRVTRRTQAFQASLEILDDGTYRQPGNLLCSAEFVDDAEVGVWRALSRKRFILEPSNLDALVAAAVDCLSADLEISVSFQEYHHVLRLQGSRLRGRTVARGQVSVDNRHVRFSAVARFRGLPDTNDAASPEEGSSGVFAAGVQAHLAQR